MQLRSGNTKIPRDVTVAVATISFKEVFASVIVLAHGAEGRIFELEEDREQIYPTNMEECIAQNKMNLNFGEELDNTYLYNIALLGFKGYSSKEHEMITSRYMKGTELNRIYQLFYLIIKYKLTGDKHDATIMNYNKLILRLFFSEPKVLETFNKMFIDAESNEAFKTGDWTTFNEFIEKNIVDASTIMPERVSLISKMIFHETPSTVYTSLKQLKGLSHDTFSGVFLAFTNIFKIAGLFDITLCETWKTINSLFGYDDDDDLYNAITRYIYIWNIEKTEMYIEMFPDTQDPHPVKIKLFYSVNMYHIIFIILDYINQLTTTNNYVPVEMNSIDDFLKYMCSTFILKLYINSFACRDCQYDFKVSSLRRTSTRQKSSGVILTRSVADVVKRSLPPAEQVSNDDVLDPNETVGDRKRAKGLISVFKKDKDKPYKHNSTNIVYGQDLPAILSTRRKNKRKRRNGTKRKRTKRRKSVQI